MPDLDPGSEFAVSRLVADDDLASSLSSDPDDAFPAVFATSRMVALMELAAARLMKPLLAEGELSVGVSLDVTHEAATPAGARVEARARFRGKEGPIFVFDVEARDPGGIVGRGAHRRAIVSTERLVAGAAKRLG